MPRFMAVHTAPFTEEQLKQLAAAQLNPPFPVAPGTACRETFCGFADDKFFCNWEGPTKQAVVDVLTAMQVPFDAVYEVKRFDFGTAQLEP